MAASNLTAQRVRELLNYDEATGVFTRAVRSGTKVKIGAIAGHKQCRGYLAFCLEGQPRLAHRVAWLYVHGVPPSGQIDHINGDKTDNRIANLRDVQPMTNSQNKRHATMRNKSGFLGVCRDRHGKKWIAQIRFGGKRIHLGTFDTPEAAHEAYLSAKRENHGGCTI